MSKIISNIRRYLVKGAAITAFAGIMIINIQGVEAGTLRDIDQSSDYARSSIVALSEQKVISGDEQGNFNPHRTVTRAELVKFIVNAMKIDTTNISGVQTFKDVPAGHWAYKYIEAAYREGLVKGVSSDTFGADQKCTREQMAVIFARSQGLSDEFIVESKEFENVGNFTDKASISDWSKGAIEFSVASGLMNGTGASAFSPKGQAEREQVAVVTYRYLENQESIRTLAQTAVDNYEKNKNTAKFPELYQAFQNSASYKGDFTSRMTIGIEDKNTNEGVSIDFDMSGKINESGFQAIYTSKTLMADFPEIVQQFEIIVLGEKAYLKYPDNEAWTVKTLEEMKEEGLSMPDLGMAKEDNAIFLSSFNKLNVEKEGTVNIEDVEATKYLVTLDEENAKKLLSGNLADDSMSLDEIYNNGMELQIEIYLNGQNQIVKEAYAFNGGIVQDGQDLSMTMNISIDYKNIGADVEIIEPVQE